MMFVASITHSSARPWPMFDVDRLLSPRNVDSSSCSGLTDDAGDAREELVPSTRRRFLARLSALGLAIPGVGTALASCSQGTPNRTDSSRPGVGRGASESQSPRAQGIHNP